jgi:hypothetical protein
VFDGRAHQCIEHGDCSATRYAEGVPNSLTVKYIDDYFSAGFKLFCHIFTRLYPLLLLQR